MSDLDFIEACYEAASSEADWGARLAEGMARVVPEALGVMAAPYRIEPSGISYGKVVGDVRFAAEPAYAMASRRIVEAANAFPHRKTMLSLGFGASTPRITVVSELPPQMAATVRSVMPWPDSDIVSLFGSLDGKQGYVMSPGGSGRFRISRHRRRQFTRLSEHLAAGYRLRALSPTASSLENGAAAVCTPDGRVLHDAGDAPALSERLVDAVRGMDRARCRRQKRTPEEATELWQALLVGQYMLVETFERSGRRLILAVRCRTPRPALTRREAAVAALAARGAANKTIAADLGLATSTVGVHLAAALRKLGCPSRRALSQWLQARGGLS